MLQRSRTSALLSLLCLSLAAQGTPNGAKAHFADCQAIAEESLKAGMQRMAL